VANVDWGSCAGGTGVCMAGLILGSPLLLPGAPHYCRLFLRKLRTTLRIPVLALVDSDPYGLKILSVYMKVGITGVTGALPQVQAGVVCSCLVLLRHQTPATSGAQAHSFSPARRALLPCPMTQVT
jgi:hypothetical protein